MSNKNKPNVIDLTAPEQRAGEEEKSMALLKSFNHLVDAHDQPAESRFNCTNCKAEPLLEDRVRDPSHRGNWHFCSEKCIGEYWSNHEEFEFRPGKFLRSDKATINQFFKKSKVAI
jgi:hypothetical protein